MLSFFFKKRLDVILNGGLGNQLFIYAAAKNFANKNKIKKLFFYSHYGMIQNVKDISFYISSIKIQKKIFNNFFDFFLMFLKNKLISSLVTDQQQSKKNLFNKFFINGYFQNIKFYKPVLEIIINELFSIKLRNYLKKIELHDIVISFRRSDYIKMGCCLDESYYFNSLKKLNIKKNEKIKIISDDTNHADKFRKYLKKKGYKVYKNQQYLNSKSLNDFLVLIKSKKLIMSNSSFCWWASACRSKLNLKSNYVICPKEWFPNNKNIIDSIFSNHPGNPFGWKLEKSKFII